MACKQTKGAEEWCQGADNWDDDNNCNPQEDNGNLNNPEKMSDDDETCSLEDSITVGIGNIAVDDPNANTGLDAAAQGVYYLLFINLRS